MSLTLVILAAGSARRYGALKQLVPVGPAGEALLEYAAHDAREAGFDRVVLVIRREQENTFRSRFDATLGRAMALDLAFQSGDATHPSARPRPWGTGHAVLSARTCVRGSFGVVNADDFYGRDAFRAMARWLVRSERRAAASKHAFAGAVMGYRVDQTLSPEGPVSRALLQRREERLLEVEELPSVELRGDSIVAARLDGSSLEIAADTPVSMNMWGFEPSVFGPLRDGFERFREASMTSTTTDDEAVEQEFMLPSFVNREIEAGRAVVDVLPAKGPWTGMTFESDRDKTASFLAELTRRGDYPSPLFAN